LDFYTALNLGLSIGLIDLNLFRRTDRIRKERKDVIHQLWLYKNRRNSIILRRTLERLERIARALSKVTNELTNEIGIEEIFKTSAHDAGLLYHQLEVGTCANVAALGLLSGNR
jgi:hypothetical protein